MCLCRNINCTLMFLSLTVKTLPYIRFALTELDISTFLKKIYRDDSLMIRLLLPQPLLPSHHSRSTCSGTDTHWQHTDLLTDTIYTILTSQFTTCVDLNCEQTQQASVHFHPWRSPGCFFFYVRPSCCVFRGSADTRKFLKIHNWRKPTFFLHQII